MRSDTFDVTIEISENGSPWQKIAAGFWGPGELLILDQPDEVPQQVFGHFAEIDVRGSESGGFSDVPIGNKRYRINFTRKAVNEAG